MIKRLSTYVCYSHARLVLIKCGSCLEESVYQCIIVRVTLCTRHIIYLLTRGCDLPLHEFVSKQTPRIHTKRSRGPLCYRVQGGVERYLGYKECWDLLASTKWAFRIFTNSSFPQLTSSGYYIDGFFDWFVIWMSWSQSDYLERSQSAKTGDMHYQTADIKGFVKVRILQHFTNTKIIDVDLRIT